MKLSKSAFEEILKKMQKRFPVFIGTSLDGSANGVWAIFCAKKPIEFHARINSVRYIIRVANDAYAVCVPNPSGFFKVYSF